MAWFESKEQKKLNALKLKLEISKIKNAKYLMKTEQTTREMRHFINKAKEMDKLGDLFEPNSNEWVDFANSPVGQQLTQALVGFTQSKMGTSQEILVKPNSKAAAQGLDIDGFISKASMKQKAKMLAIYKEAMNGS